MKQAQNTTAMADAIDMTRTMAPDAPGFAEHIRHALAYVAQTDGLAHTVQRHRFFGTEHERSQVANWLTPRLGFRPDPDQLYITGGTQNCLQVILPQVAKPGRPVVTEKLSYAGTSQICRLYGIDLVGVDIDDDGILPDAFRDVCRKHRPGVLYTNPTIHNPTTSILPEDRRRNIARIAREYDVAIVEDDVHGKLVADAPPTIASVAPDITWYIMSVSKCIGMGLRCAFLVAPSPERLAEMRAPIQSISAWFVPGITSALFSFLIESGRADQIVHAVVDQIHARQAIATEALSGFDIRTKPESLHLWLGLPDSWSVSALVDAVAPHNITVRPSDLFNAGRIAMPNAVRLSLVAPKTDDDLHFAVETIATMLADDPAHAVTR